MTTDDTDLDILFMTIGAGIIFLFEIFIDYSRERIYKLTKWLKSLGINTHA